MDNNSMWKAVLITGKPKKKKESTPINELNQKLLVNTSDLMRLLSLGRPSAVQIEAKVVQTYLGHASIKMTLDTYTHVATDKLYEDMQKVSVFQVG